MKKIEQKTLDEILNLLVKYNVGIQEYSQVAKLFTSLPLIEEDKKEKK